MTTPAGDPLYLAHISECLGRIAEYTRGGRDEFMADVKTRDAVLRNPQVMAESTQRPSTTVKAAHPEVDWRGIGAFRNVLTHADLSINLARVWETVTTDLPPFSEAIKTMSQQDPNSGSGAS